MTIGVYVKARFATQPVSKPAGRFQSRLASFETGWPDSELVKGNGPLRNGLGERLRNGLGGRLRNLLVDADELLTGQ